MHINTIRTNTTANLSDNVNSRRRFVSNNFTVSSDITNPHRNKRHPFVTLYDKFKNPVSACINKTGKNAISLSCGTDTLGCCDFSECNAPIAGDNYPDYYKNKKYLFINSLSSTKKFKGIGTELVKEAVRESYRRNLGGRVCLTASSTKAELNSPVPFYYKLGFQATRKDIWEKIKKAMTEGLPLPKECESTTMFLPPDKINEILFS